MSGKATRRISSDRVEVLQIGRAEGLASFLLGRFRSVAIIVAMVVLLRVVPGSLVPYVVGLILGAVIVGWFVLRQRRRIRTIAAHHSLVVSGGVERSVAHRLGASGRHATTDVVVVDDGVQLAVLPWDAFGEEPEKTVISHCRVEVDPAGRVRRAVIFLDGEEVALMNPASVPRWMAS